MNLDQKFSSFIANFRGRRACLDSLGVFCARKLVMWLGLMVMAWAMLSFEINQGEPGLGLFLVVFVTATAWLVTYILEYSFGRKRPFRTLKKQTLGTYWVPAPSFPSAHATIAFALATCAVMLIADGAWSLYLLATLVAFGRVYVGVHYLSDVVAGAVVGSVVSWGLLMILGF